MTDEDFDALCARRDANTARIAQLAIVGRREFDNENEEGRQLADQNAAIEVLLRQELTNRTDPNADWGVYAIEFFSSGGERVLRIPMTDAREEVLNFARHVPVPPMVTMTRVVRVLETSPECEIWSGPRGNPKG